MPQTLRHGPGGRATARKRGRPTKYRAEFAKSIVTFCAKGFSLTAFAASIGSHRQQIDDWCELSAEFADATHRAKAAATYYWEKLAHRQANRGASGGQVAMTLFMLKNFGKDDFSDTVKHTGPDGGPLALELLLGKLNQPDIIEALPAQIEKPSSWSLANRESVMAEFGEDSPISGSAQPDDADESAT